MDKIVKKKVKVISMGTENIYKITDDYNFIKKVKEIYISEIEPNTEKKWKYSNKTTQSLYIFNSKIKLITAKNLNKKKNVINLNKNLSYLVKIPKNTFYTFKNIGKEKGFILNMIDTKYKKNN